MERFCRIEQLIGADALGRLQRSRVAVFGLGAVGWLIEALLSAVIAAALHRMLPGLFSGAGGRRLHEAHQHGPVSH